MTAPPKAYKARAVTEAITALLSALQIDEQVIDGTPQRCAGAYAELLCGYFEPCPPLKVFESQTASIIFKGNLQAASLCPHHLLPYLLTASFAYIPSGHVIGISKIARLLRWCAGRLILQEDLGALVLDVFNKRLLPQGAAILLNGNHMCERIRGVRSSSVTTTTVFTGVFHAAAELRKEFYELHGAGGNSHG